MSGHAGEIVDLQALADDHAWITSVDSCCFCGDGECDGIGCIACIDPDLAGGGDEWHHERLENLHALLREGQAWRVMQTLRLAGAEPLAALVVAASSLANANNQRPWPEDAVGVVPHDWVRSDIPHEGDYAHVNQAGDVCFYNRRGRCDTRIPARLLASFRAWLASVPTDPPCVVPGGCTTSDACAETEGCVMRPRQSGSNRDAS